MRAGELAIGAMLGLLLCTPVALSWVQRRCGQWGFVMRRVRQPLRCVCGDTPLHARCPPACRRGLVAAAAFALQASYAALMVCCDHHAPPGSTAPWPRRTAVLYAALLYFASPFVALVVAATLLALVLRSDALHGAAAAALGAAGLRPAAALSYSLYLLADWARLWALHLLVPAGALAAAAAAAPVAALAGLLASTLACGYAVAAVVQAALERPLKR